MTIHVAFRQTDIRRAIMAVDMLMNRADFSEIDLEHLPATIFNLGHIDDEAKARRQDTPHSRLGGHGPNLVPQMSQTKESVMTELVPHKPVNELWTMGT